MAKFEEHNGLSLFVIDSAVNNVVFVSAQRLCQLSQFQQFWRPTHLWQWWPSDLHLGLAEGHLCSQIPLRLAVYLLVKHNNNRQPLTPTLLILFVCDVLQDTHPMCSNVDGVPTSSTSWAARATVRSGSATFTATAAPLPTSWLNTRAPHTNWLWPRLRSYWAAAKTPSSSRSTWGLTNPTNSWSLSNDLMIDFGSNLHK